MFFIFIAIQKTTYHLEVTNPTMIKLREKSHCYLRIGLYLLVKRATVYVTNDCMKHKLLNYICKLYEILSKFTDVYFGYKYPGVINKFAKDCDAEIKQGCVFVQELCRIIKIRVSVLLRMDVKSQEIIHYILRKVTSKLQAFLVHIDYWNKEMYNMCYVNKSK